MLCDLAIPGRRDKCTLHLLGTTVPGLTAVDLALWTVILFLLVAITVRTLWLLEEGTGWRLLRTRRRHRRQGEPPA